MAFVLVLIVFLATNLRFALCQDPGLAWIWPPPVGFDLTTANVAPCGGFDTYHDGPLTYFLDQLRWNQTASQITYMTRVSRNLNASGDWDELYPTIEAAVDQTNSKANAASFCLPIPETSDPEQQNQTNIFQLIANTPHGIVFACSKVKFARVADRTYGSTCVPSIRGNSTVNNVTDQAILSAALLPVGSSATMLPSASPSQSAGAGAVQSTASPSSSSSVSGGAIAGIVVGSLAGACALALLVVMLLVRRRRQEPSSVLPVKRDSVFTSMSDSSGYDNTDLEKKWPSELPALVPTELPAAVPVELDSTARVEMPTSEKDFRPELPNSEAGPLPEKMPIPEEPAVSSTGYDDESVYSDDRTPVSSPTITAVSPTSDRPSRADTSSPVSPVSPMISRADRHF